MSRPMSRPTSRPFAALLATLLAIAAPAAAQDIRTERVAFAAGSTGATLPGAIVGRESVSYLVGAEAGQLMTISLDASNLATYFNLYGPGSGPGDEALANGELTPETNRFSGTLPASGDYTISVYLVRAAARRGERSDYTLEVSITGALGPVVEGDFADGLQGGPDFWQVTGLSAGDTLNLRAGPSTGATVLGRLPEGATLRNLGCRMAEGQRWCNVAPVAGGDPGWVAGRYLTEAAGPAGAAGGPEGDALVPGTGFHAVGGTPCSAGPDRPEETCAFGVTRDGGGDGVVEVTLPDGGVRRIRYEGGAPIAVESSGAPVAFEAARAGDAYVIGLGGVRLTLPDAVIFGG